MTTTEIMLELTKLGSEQTKKTFINHGAPPNTTYGVKIGDLKIIQKKIKKNYKLALELYDTKISDAMYLAGLIADEKQMTKADLNKWVKNASWNMISEYTVPWIAAESNFAFELGLEWIDSDKEKIASAGWSTLSSYLSIKPNEDIDINQLKKIISRVEKTIHQSPNRVKYWMNNFIICCGSYVNELNEIAKKTAVDIGEVSVNVGNTACKVPNALEYILKVEGKKKIGMKKKMARC